MQCTNPSASQGSTAAVPASTTARASAPDEATPHHHHHRARPSVDVGDDGELQVQERDSFARLMRLADMVEEREHAQLGYVDTIRVSKEGVETSVRKRRE